MQKQPVEIVGKQSDVEHEHGWAGWAVVLIGSEMMTIKIVNVAVNTATSAPGRPRLWVLCLMLLVLVLRPVGARASSAHVRRSSHCPVVDGQSAGCSGFGCSWLTRRQFFQLVPKVTTANPIDSVLRIWHCNTLLIPDR